MVTKRQQPFPDFRWQTTIDIKNKAQRDYWTRRWGVSVHQLRAVNSNEVKIIRQYLQDKGAL